MRIMKLGFVCVLMAATLSAGAQLGSRLQPALAKIDTFLQSLVDTANIPGIAAVIVKDGKVIYGKGFGVSSKTTGKHMEPENTFHIASISKTFTATAVMQLSERGKIDITKPLTAYLPYFSMKDSRYRQITVKQLLNHTSGMPDVDDYEWEKAVSDEGAAERYVRSLADSQLISEPGREYHYSNIGFDIMADLVAKVSGQSFETFVTQHILRPLDMRNSSFIYRETKPSLRTSPHIGNPATVSPVYPYNRMHAPSSTLNTSAMELSHYAMAYMNDGVYKGRRILQSATLQELTTPTFLGNPARGVSVCLSWFSYGYRGLRVLEHGGSDTGFRTMLNLLPEKKLAIILLCNLEEVKIFNMRNYIRDLLLDNL